MHRILLLMICSMLLGGSHSYAQYFIDIDPTLSYTLPHRQYLQKGNDLRYRFENDALCNIGIGVGYKFDNKHKVSLRANWTEFHFKMGRMNNYSGGGWGFAGYGVFGHYIVPNVGLHYQREYISEEKRNGWFLGGGIALGYFLDNKLTNDTSVFNSFNNRNYDRLSTSITVEEISKGSRWVPMVRLFAGYKMAIGKRVYFSPNVLYQLGFSNFITFKYKMQYKGMNDYTLVNNSFRGSAIQLVLKFEYEPKVRSRVQYLMR